MNWMPLFSKFYSWRNQGDGVVDFRIYLLIVLSLDSSKVEDHMGQDVSTIVSLPFQQFVAE